MEFLEALRRWVPGNSFELDLPDLKKEPRVYQKVAASYIYFSKRCILADPTGSGKTFSALISSLLFSEKNNIENVLIVTPYSRKQWQNEIDKFLGWNSLILEGPKKKRSLLYKETRFNFFTIMSYDVLVSDVKTVSKLKWDLVIYDEATAFKNHTTTRWACVHYLSMSILKLGGCTLGLSAYPVEGHFSDVYGVFAGIGVNLGTYESFEKRYLKVGHISVFLWKKSPRLNQMGSSRFCPTCGGLVFPPYKQCGCGLKFKWEKKIPKIIGCKDLPGLQLAIKDHYLMRNKETLLPELPPVVIEPVLLPFSKQQRAAYDSLNQEFLDPLVRCTYEREICSHPSLRNKKGDSAKLNWIDSALDSDLGGKKIVYFSRFHKTINELIKILESHQCNPVKLTGEQNAEEKEAAVEKFWGDPTCLAMVGTTAIEKSYNFHCADTVIIIDLIENPVRIAQIIGRIARQGSEFSSLLAILLLMEDSIDSELVSVIEDKIGNITDLMGKDSFELNFDAVPFLLRKRAA